MAIVKTSFVLIFLNCYFWIVLNLVLQPQLVTWLTYLFLLEVQVYPNGGEEDQKGRVSVFLNNLSDRQVYIAATFKFLDSECSFKQPIN